MHLHILTTATVRCVFPSPPLAALVHLADLLHVRHVLCVRFHMGHRRHVRAPLDQRCLLPCFGPAHPISWASCCTPPNSEFLEEKYDMSKKLAGHVTSVPYLMSAGMSPFLGFGVDKLGRSVLWSEHINEPGCLRDIAFCFGVFPHACPLINCSSHFCLGSIACASSQSWAQPPD